MFIRITNDLRNYILYPPIFVGHILYELFAGQYLFRLAGGIRDYPNGRWTEYGGIKWAYETPLYIPGSYLCAKTNIGPCTWHDGGWSLLLLLIANILTMIATGQLIQKVINKDPKKFGNFYWRLIIIILGWVFIPVPVEMTNAYIYTVLC